MELYHLETDPGERNNLAAIHPEKKEELLALLMDWLEKEGAAVDFEYNPDFDEGYLLGLEAAYN